MADQPTRKRLYFFWDYDITEEDLRAILSGDNETEKAWAMTRRLEAAKWEDIWRFITLKQLIENFDSLHFRFEFDREIWAYAIKL